MEYSNGKSKPFCRTHLIKEFEKEYSGFDKKMVVVYPDLEEKKTSDYTYQYYSIEEIKKFNMPDEVLELTKRALNSISGNCQKCSVLAKVAFFGKGTFRWEDDSLKLEKIDKIPDLLCRKCAFRPIEDSLRQYQGYFSEPVISPHKDEGILLPWIL